MVIVIQPQFKGAGCSKHANKAGYSDVINSFWRLTIPSQLGARKQEKQYVMRQSKQFEQRGRAHLKVECPYRSEGIVAVIL